jgi:hypothetical protein
MGWRETLNFRNVPKVANEEVKARIRESDELIKQAISVITFLDRMLGNKKDELNVVNPDEEQVERSRQVVELFNQRLRKVKQSLYAAVQVKQEAQAPVWEVKVFNLLNSCQLQQGNALEASIRQTHAQLQTILNNLKDPATKGMLIASVKGAKQKNPVEHHIHQANKNPANDN